MRRRLYAVRHPGAQHGLMRHASIDAFEPIIPPPQHLLQEPDLRAGTRKMRITMRPRPDETLARHGQSLEEAWNCVRIAVSPTPGGVHRTLDRRVILAYRSMFTISIASLVHQQDYQEQRTVRLPHTHHRPPALYEHT